MAVINKYIEGKSPVVNAEIPKILYKYRNSSERSLDILRHKQIFFSSSEVFNDPFDCFTPARFDLLSEQEYDDLSVYVIQKLSGLSKEAAFKHYSNVAKKKAPYGVEQLAKMKETQLQELRDKATIFCLSGTNDNILMWSHYADNHRGICIGFDANIVYNNTGAMIGVAKYSELMEKIKPLPDDSPTPIIQVLTKSKVWEYENEIRLVSWSSKKLFDIEPEAIKEIIFGCAITDSAKQEVLRIVDSDKSLKHVKLFEAKQELYKYNLRIQSRTTN